jgi:hypothetical protein
LFEYQQSYLFNNPERKTDSRIEPFFPVEQPQLGFRIEHKMLQERLSLTGTGVVLGIWNYTGWLARAEVSYQLRDALTVGIGYIIYQPNDEMSIINGFTKHDRVYASLRWDYLFE